MIDFIFDNRAENMLSKFAKEDCEYGRMEDTYGIEGFLKAMHFYECVKDPKHPAFVANYKKGGTFDVNDFLNYYLNPWGDGKYTYRYVINADSVFPLIYKKKILCKRYTTI